MFRNLLLVAVALSLFAGLASAQTITGSITGTVSDPSGAIVPGGSVIATNTETNVRSTTSTNSEGIYTFPFLRVGPYTISVEAKGFKKSVVGPFPIETNQVGRVDVKLEIGDTTLTVEVTGDESKVEKFLNLMKPFGVLDWTRTGKVALPRN